LRVAEYYRIRNQGYFLSTREEICYIIYISYETCIASEDGF